MLTCLAAVETIKSDNPVNIASIQNPKVYKIMAPSHPRHRTLADASVPRILECLSLATNEGKHISNRIVKPIFDSALSIQSQKRVIALVVIGNPN